MGLAVIVVSNLDLVRGPTAIALGNFDGIHRGHRRVIEPILHRSGLVGTVVSFNPHPRDFFSGSRSLLLTPLREKVSLLERLGVEQLVLLPFDEGLAQLRAEIFMDQMLQGRLQAKFISVGFNFRFGFKRQGDGALLRSVWGDRLEVAAEQTMGDGLRISSSAVRTALAMGDVSLANDLLGRRYSISGNVISGQQLGRKLGFPTANLQVDQQKYLPKDGVYGVMVGGNPGVMNMGVRPTVGGGLKRTIEVHLLNWRGNLYDQEIVVELVRYIRGERKFNSFEELKAQIQRDCEVVKDGME